MAKLLLTAVLGLTMTLAMALITTPFFYAGWNFGLFEAFGWAREITLLQAFWLSLFVNTIGSCFRSTVTVSGKD